ncbi:hypothetical protein K1T71_006317 [Dendrolimus kikuchii]|uniref:Uncharacterized protein n=1 Tax=Dendrolimus kikuchii TaxID=765133 RepID=A0ACC1D441_9NEOP|nr:hypothetical protein K1T71_006317 [Dendrolimus kikuchii]
MMSNEQEKMLQSYMYMLADDSDESNSDESDFDFKIEEDVPKVVDNVVALQPFQAGVYCVVDGILQPKLEAMDEEGFATLVTVKEEVAATSVIASQQPGADDAPLASTSSYESEASTSREDPVASTSRHRGRGDRGHSAGHRRGIRGCRGRGSSLSCGSSEVYFASSRKKRVKMSLKIEIAAFATKKSCSWSNYHYCQCQVWKRQGLRWR